MAGAGPRPCAYYWRLVRSDPDTQRPHGALAALFESVAETAVAPVIVEGADRLPRDVVVSEVILPGFSTASRASQHGGRVPGGTRRASAGSTSVARSTFEHNPARGAAPGARDGKAPHGGAPPRAGPGSMDD